MRWEHGCSKVLCEAPASSLLAGTDGADLVRTVHYQFFISDDLAIVRTVLPCGSVQLDRSTCHGSRGHADVDDWICCVCPAFCGSQSTDDSRCTALMREGFHLVLTSIIQYDFENRLPTLVGGFYLHGLEKI